MTMRRRKLALLRRPQRALTLILVLSLFIFIYTQMKTHSKKDCVYCRSIITSLNDKSQIPEHDEKRLELPAQVSGKLNVDIWKSTCMLSFNSLRQHPFFPSQPHTRLYLKIQESLSISVNGNSYGLRVLGYLHPPQTGYYTFYLRSYFMSQFWLSTSEAVGNTTKLMAYTTRNQLDKSNHYVGRSKPSSEKIFLEQGKKYYFEILKILNIVKLNDETRLYWMLPEERNFSKIAGRYFSNYFNLTVNNQSSYGYARESYGDNNSPALAFSDDEDKRVAKLCRLKAQPKPVEMKQFDRDNVRGLPYLERKYYVMAFPQCRYEPSYMKRREYKRYEGVWNVFYPMIYPENKSWNVRWANPKKAFGVDDRFNGSIFISTEEAESVVESFMDVLHNSYPGTFEFINTINMEKVHDKEKGDRFLLELVLQRHHDNKLLRVSELVYRNKSQHDLCILKDLVWNPKVWINVILNAKNQANWVVYFIQDIARVLRETDDKYVHVIIVDFGNKGLDIDKELQRHGIKSYNVIKQNGVFYKTASINLAASTVKDPDSIVLLMDLHLHLPLDFFDKIRKHTFKGILAFAPILLRLDSCGRPRTKHLFPIGYWESLGFGIFGIYKSDWDAIGGMNVKDFKNKWGGEDWEMVDRVLAKGIEIDKQRLPGFYHFYHDKKGMWDNQ